MVLKKTTRNGQAVLNELYKPDKQDEKLLKGKSKSYIIGWNKVKYAKQLQTHSRRDVCT